MVVTHMVIISSISASAWSNSATISAVGSGRFTIRFPCLG